MPRSLTGIECNYLRQLALRNFDPERDAPDDEPKDKPMSNWERQMRFRLRRKAIRLALDLDLIFRAGVYPELGEHTVEIPEELVDRIRNRRLDLLLLTEPGDIEKMNYALLGSSKETPVGEDDYLKYFTEEECPTTREHLARMKDAPAGHEEGDSK